MQELFQQYPAVIAGMPAEFTSHQFIQALTQAHQRAYIDALVVVRDTGDPFRRVHGLLAQRLHQHPDLVERLPDVDSPDIFGDVVRCASWRRR